MSGPVLATRLSVDLDAFRANAAHNRAGHRSPPHIVAERAGVDKVRLKS